MRKLVVLVLISLFLIGACAQQKPENLVGGGTQLPQNTQAANSGIVKEFRMTAKQFVFDPETIEVNKGDKVRLIVTSLDVPHGIAIPEYRINERLEPGKPVTIEFTADKQGTFTAYCSVLCGSGHRDMKGKIIVH